MGLIVAGRFRNDIPMNLSFSHLATAFIGSILCLSSAIAQQPAPMNPPPMAQPVSASVYAGRSVDIPLQATGRTPGQIRFVIRTKPRYGTLGEIRLTSRTTAVVPYKRSDKDSLQPDSFRYAAQAVDSPVSAAADILISVTEEAPRLKAPKEVDFGDVFIGESASRTITLKNDGGGSLLGRLESGEDFHMENSADLILTKGQEKKVKLVFRPTKEGSYASFLAFDTSPRTGVAILGAARSPLQVEPSGSMALSRDTPSVLSITNLSASGLKLSLSVPDGVEVLSALELAAGASASVEVAVQPSHLKAVEGSLTIQTAGFTRQIPLTAFAAPPLLRVFPAGGLDFGELSVGEKNTRSLRLANLGGSDARIQTTLPFGVLSDPSLSAIVLSPGEERAFTVSFEASEVGSFKQDLTIEAAGAPTLHVPLRGEVSAPASVAQVAPTPRGPALSVLPEVGVSKPAPPLLSLAPPPSRSTLPPINAFSVRKATPHFIQISWPQPEGQISRYIVEKRRLEPDGDNPPRAIWENWRDVDFQSEGKDVVASFKDLPANVAWFIRVSFVDAQGKVSVPSPTLRIGTPPAPRSFTVYWIGALVLLVMGFLLRRKMFAHREIIDSEDARRIARLE